MILWTPDKIKRKLTAILSADVKGYSRLMGEDEEWTLRTLNTYKGLIRNLVRQHRGRVVGSPGDNVLAEFASVVDAVRVRGGNPAGAQGQERRAAGRPAGWSFASGSTWGM